MTKLVSQTTKISTKLSEENFADEAESCDKTTIPQNSRTPNSHTKFKSYKIIVLGESGVGKTCLSFRFCAGRFPVHSEATIGLDFREKIVEIEGERLKLQIWDTAGQERFRKSITHHYYRNVDAVIFVYDVNSLGSLMSLDEWVDEVEQHGVREGVPRVLVGNKCDEASAGSQVVTTNAAQIWADERNMPLFETSAKDDSMSDHVDGIFLTLAHKCVSGKRLISPLSDTGDQSQPVRLLYQSNIAAPPQQQEETCCF